MDFLLSHHVLPAGLFDAAKEIARLEKQQEKAAAEVANADARLSNQSFVAKAPEHVVAGFRNQREAAQQKLQLLAEKMEQMRRLM